MSVKNSLAYIDPIDSLEIIYDGKNFIDKKDKKSFIGARVSYNDVILHSFKVPSSTSDDEISTQAEIKMYDYAGLDLEKQYKIIYIKKKLDFEESVLVEAIAIDTDSVKDSLSGVLAKTKHIDYLALPFLSFSTLYKNKIIEPKNDIFIYIGGHEAFLSIYRDGKYLSSKSFLNIEEIWKKLENAGSSVTLDELKVYLEEKGLDATAYERGESIIYNELEQHFSGMLTKLNDVFVHNRSVFGFDRIDRIFFSTKNGRVKGMREFIHNFGFSEVEVLDFNLFKEKSDEYLFEKIVTAYIDDCLEEKNFEHNLTFLERSPAFYKKESGKILIGASFIVSLSLLFSGYVWYENTILEEQQILLQSRYDIMKKLERKYRKNIKTVKADVKKVLEKKKSMEARIENISVSIKKLEKLRNDEKMYSGFLLDINGFLKKHALSTRKIEVIDRDSMSIELVAHSKKRDSITEFMKDLIDYGYIGITTEEIKLDDNIYISRVEIKR